ncbi:hypothetical protein NIES4071_94850 [Calothrix sp. NIES-4071]|nr:hypothetical protein NIES4071_94850 [Calothrix sp. NIES-4071]BAZ63750.1 hypothetical protein NIES4105_94780 [Calothrix sp. NIES-4105]
MELSPKAIRFIIEALDYRIKAYEESLAKDKINEDESSEIANDAIFLEAIREDLVKASRESEEVRVSIASSKV